ncbi:hypothetical protein A5724_08100 [Mycobacterium sp. ACS1612]|uniref:hypothetical protein n=1 Tax=Mycobacterium sp. ACS1612 TaxID=1834117 RepID=UPI0008006110|nr:hypothetical protein [Mycobacterium sp. ACS1612]OBF39628.1 hypothetical protein A5724_08100 [Mycobacterium sp. ACS1612]
MAFTHAMAAALAVTCAAVGLASPAWADTQLDGDYTFVDGPTSTTWSITTQCNAARTCGGTISTSRGWVGAINRVDGGPWTAERRAVADAWTCADGSTGPADLLYSFDPESLAGTATLTSKPGTCNDPNSQQGQQPVSLQPA